MTVSAGQPVKASVVNEAFLSRKNNTSAAGILSLLNTSPDSGPAISNTQKSINELLERKAEVEGELGEINEELLRLDGLIQDNQANITALQGRGNSVHNTDPTENDDVSEGYSVGAIWKNAETGTYFFCDDASEGAAVWSEIKTGGGGGVASATLVSADRTVEEEDSLLIVDCFSITDDDITITLPAIIEDSPRTLYIKKIDSSDHKVIIAADGDDEIEGEADFELLYQWDSVTLVSTNYGWVIL